MKTNKMMRIASVLLVAVILSTCAISGTFAKYTSTGSADDSARVAKWGVTITPTTGTSNTTFKNNYDNTVIGTSSEKVVAPGTNGTLTGLAIGGTAEVKVEVSWSASLELTGWEITTGTEYCPIIITVDSKDFYIGGSSAGGAYSAAATGTTEITTVAQLIAAVNAAATKTVQIDPNATIQGYSVEVSWKWMLDKDAASNPLSTYQDDEKDTKLGQLDTAPTIKFTISATVTQVD